MDEYHFNATSVHKFMNQIKALQEIHPEITIIQMFTFIDTATMPRYTVCAPYLMQKYDISQAQASRAGRRLTVANEGYGLCCWEIDPLNARVKYLTLTESGKDLARRVAKYFN